MGRSFIVQWDRAGLYPASEMYVNTHEVDECSTRGRHRSHPSNSARTTRSRSTDSAPMAEAEGWTPGARRGGPGAGRRGGGRRGRRRPAPAPRARRAARTDACTRGIWRPSSLRGPVSRGPGPWGPGGAAAGPALSAPHYQGHEVHRRGAIVLEGDPEPFAENKFFLLLHVHHGMKIRVSTVTTRCPRL